MKGILALAIVASILGVAPVPQLCLGAQYAIVMAQERSTPPGEWCQRPERPMPKGAHACNCHKQDCTDPEPSHESAHTDPMCKNYCHQDACECKHMDCK